MELGVVVPNSGALGRPDALLAIAERAEALGFACLWTADHLVLPIESSTWYPYLPGLQVRPDPRHAFLDPMIALAGIATRTRRIRLGVSVYLAALRHPIVAAKLVASLDRLSEGRVCLGVGSGWIPEEYATLGIEFSERGRVLDDHLASLRALWSQEAPVHRGPWFAFDNIGFEPKPVQDPLPIWIGGNSRPARRRAARLGDGWHVIDLSAKALEPGRDDLHRLCDEVGRSPSEVPISMRAQITLTERPLPPDRPAIPLIGPRDRVLDEMHALRELGLAHLALWPSAREIELEAYLEAMDRIASDIAPALGIGLASDQDVETRPR